MAKKRRIVEIEWEDSSGYGSGAWQSKKQRLKTDSCHSVGYVHRETKTHIELAAHLSEYCTCGNMAIPKTAIRTIREIANA